MTMNTFVSTLCRDLACGVAAILITAVFGMSFVASTALPPGAHAPAVRTVGVQPEHAWFGQPEPAVLVD
jgi:hypothetical protein